MKKIIVLSACVIALLCGCALLSSCGHTHTPMTVVSEKVAATCTTRGIDEIIVSCAECGEEISRTPTVHDKLAHKSSEWIVDLESTCVEAGSKHTECTVCHEILETAEIPTGDVHEPVTDEAVEPTETESGLTEGSHCALCGAVIVEQEVVAAILEGGALHSKQLTVDLEGEAVSGEVHREIFSFLKDITVAKGASYILSKDIGCGSPIVSKTVKLTEGENVFYIFVSNKSEQVLYTVTIVYDPSGECEFCNPTLSEDEEPSEPSVDEAE